MGLSTSRENFEENENWYSYRKEIEFFEAYKSIKRIHENIHNIMRKNVNEIIENVYFIKTYTISNYLKILKDLDILKNIADIRKRSEVHELEKELKNDFKEYKLEEKIDYIKIGFEKYKEEFEKEYEEYQNEEFIIVDRDFLERMKIQYHHHNIKLNINEEEIYIELSNKEMIIIDLF